MGDGWTSVLLFVLAGFFGEVLGVLIWAINRHVIWLIAGGTHLYTVTIASSHNIPAAVVTMFTPGLSEVYWVGHVWSAKGTFWHPLTYMCLAGLVSLGIELVGRRVFAEQIAAAARQP